MFGSGLTRTLRAAVAAVTLVLATGGVALAGTTPDPMTGAPAVGSCYDLTLEQVNGYSTSEETVPCRQHHTVLVVGVGTLPDGVSWDQESAVADAVGAQCPPTYKAALGVKRLNLLHYYRSQYSTWWLAADADQQDAGARWFTCLMTVRNGRGLTDLPRALPTLDASLPDRVARCVDIKYRFTTCAEGHQWRSTFDFYVRGKATKAHVAQAAGEKCPRHVSGRRFLQSVWDISGPRFIVACYTKTTR